MFGTGVIIAGFLSFLVFSGPFEISAPVIGIIGIIGMFTLFMTGISIGFALMITGLVFLGMLSGPSGAFYYFRSFWYNTASNYAWSPFMLFIFMGFVCFVAKLGGDLFFAANKWLGHLKGGLGIAAVGACTAFAAVVGDTLSGSITMTAVALPEMRKYKYNDFLSVGALATSGTIGQLIPPSIGFIIYAILAEQSIGDLFMAGVIPGLICSVLFMATVYIECLINPQWGPPGPKAKWGERFGSLKSTAPIAALFLLVIGGIYGGVFTPTEGGGIGAFGALCLGLLMRRIHWKELKESLTEGVRYIGMGFTILGGAMMFGTFIAASGLPRAMADTIANLTISPMAILWLVIFIFFILGCFLPYMPVLLICIPMFIPVAKALGWDLVWFGVIMVIMANFAPITPPFGINLFVIKAMTKVPMMLMYRSSLPFIVALFILTVLIVYFPALSLWLPSLMQR